MTIKATVIEDSISTDGVRLTTLALEYPNYIHPEILTHRDKSRNAASTRAIPSKKMRAWASRDMAMPTFWGSNRPGMIAGEELTGWRLWAAKRLWRLLGHIAILGSHGLQSLGLHKQHANRPMGPYLHTKVVMTGTEWDNMLALRDAPDAQPEAKLVAITICNAMNTSIPRMVGKGSWHLPFVSQEERLDCSLILCIKLSVARCARVSYLTHDGKRASHRDDVKLADRLLDSGHMSPFEHQASPTEDPKARSGNLVGWSQYRKMLPNEIRTGYKSLRRWRIEGTGSLRAPIRGAG